MAKVNNLDTVPDRLDRVEKSFSELDAQRSLLANCTEAWKDLEHHFSQVQAMVESRIGAVEEREKEYLASIEDEKTALSKREEAILVREHASIARVTEQKDSAIAALLEERRLWIAEHLAERSAAYLAATSAFGATRKTDGKDNRRPTLTAVRDVKVHPQLKSLCDKMDGEGLRKYLFTNRKETAVRDQLPCALKKSPDPLRLVLKVLEGYDPKPESKDAKASSIRRVYISLLESLALVVADPILGVEYPIVPSEVKEMAKGIANSWRRKLDISGDAATTSALDAQIFLQLLATFNIASSFNDDELLKLVITTGRRKQTPSLCRSLGLLGNMPGFLIKLAKDGKQLEALSFAHSFEIMDKIQPVNILKEYLKEAKIASEIALKKAANAAEESEAIMKEIVALKAVLKAATEYKLGSQLPTHNLQKRLEQLERANNERRRSSAVSKTPSKKLRSKDIVPDDIGSIPAVAGDAAAHDKYGGGIPLYGVPTAKGYDQHPLISAYGTANRSPPSLSNTYPFSSDRISSAYGSVSAYSSVSGLYGGYQYTSALAAPRPAYYSGPPSAYQPFRR